MTRLKWIPPASEKSSNRRESRKLPRRSRIAFAAAKSYLEGLSAEKAETVWRVNAGDREIVSMPRKWALRSIMFNHLYHHRGQLSVYLRLLDIPVPIIYGASADESPFVKGYRPAGKLKHTPQCLWDMLQLVHNQRILSLTA